jgi:hybrid polyketide synthase/nonribosomal peptide synthetase ACE1
MKHSGKNEPIAIIGSACRFPGGCSSPSKLWDLLSNPRDVSTVIDRFNVQGYYHKDGSHHGTTNVQRSYFLHEDHLKFDAQFFNISPSEAESIDPQQRVLLETVYEAVEESGKTIESLRKSDTAVYVGLMNCDYSDALYRDIDSIPTHTATAVARSIASNRLSYFFDWQGPSMTIDTACSSSLVAVHQAVQALRNGETHLAVASGTNLILGPGEFPVGLSNVL